MLVGRQMEHAQRLGRPGLEYYPESVIWSKLSRENHLETPNLLNSGPTDFTIDKWNIHIKPHKNGFTGYIKLTCKFKL